MIGLEDAELLDGSISADRAAVMLQARAWTSMLTACDEVEARDQVLVAMPDIPRLRRLVEATWRMEGAAVHLVLVGRDGFIDSMTWGYHSRMTPAERYRWALGTSE